MDTNNQDFKPEIESKVEESLKTLSGKYAIIGKWSLRSWQVWLVIGLIAGVLGGATYVANKNVARLESEQSEAGGITPVVTVISPNGGEQIFPEGVIDIKWKVDNNNAVGNNAFMLGIEDKAQDKYGRIIYTENLSQATSSLRMTNDVVTANYRYQWKVPSIKAGNYSVVIYLSNRPKIRDKSDREFEIVSSTIPTVQSAQPSITVLSPNGGETWYKGKTYAVKYKIVNDKFDGQIDIGYSKADGGAVVDIGRGIQSTGKGSYEYKWTIPANFASGKDYKIYVQYYHKDYSNIVTDQSDKYFTIK